MSFSFLIIIEILEGNSLSVSKNSGEISNGRSQSFAPNIRKNSRMKNPTDSFSNTLQKKHKEMKEENKAISKANKKKVEKGKILKPKLKWYKF